MGIWEKSTSDRIDTDLCRSGGGGGRIKQYLTDVKIDLARVKLCSLSIRPLTEQQRCN